MYASTLFDWTNSEETLLEIINMSNIELIYLMHQYENENGVDLFTFKMGRRSSTSSCVLPW
jgi:hypothetical protein